MRGRVARAAAGLAGLALAAPAFGCGHCVEDKVAAVYDHGVITTALERHHQMVFFAIAGPLPAGADARRVVARALRTADGIDSRSLRVSADSASLSLSYDEKRISSRQIMDTLNRTLLARGLSVTVMKVANP